MALDASLASLLMRRTARGAVSDAQLDALQARLHTLHASQLLGDDELCAAEDAIVDCIDMIATMPVEPVTHGGAVDKVVKLVAISERMEVDSSFARQVKRKL